MLSKPFCTFVLIGVMALMVLTVRKVDWPLSAALLVVQATIGALQVFFLTR